MPPTGPGSSSSSSQSVCEHWLVVGITTDTMGCMAMTLRLTDGEARALRRRAEHEGRPMQEVARQAIREYIEGHSRAELLDRVLDEDLPRYAEALERLGQ